MICERLNAKFMFVSSNTKAKESSPQAMESGSINFDLLGNNVFLIEMKFEHGLS